MSTGTGVSHAAPQPDLGSRSALTLAVYGDAPYGTSPTDTAQTDATPAFINAVNADPDVSLVVHVGDIHSGKQYCTEAYDRSIAEMWKSYADPLVYTPGDNEWTDCHKTGEGGGKYDPTTGQIDYVLDANGNQVDYAGGDPAANLDLVRSIFFPRPGVALGGGNKTVISQAQMYDPAYPSDAHYVENVMWEESVGGVRAGEPTTALPSYGPFAQKVMFVTVNIPGGSNNDNDAWFGAPSQSAAQAQEVADRTAADIRWLNRAFANARSDGAEAVVVITQADMWDLDGKTPDHLSAYDPIVGALAMDTSAFAKPVLLFNGDSHTYLSDNPLSASDPLNYLHPGHDVQNFHRVVVHGSTTPLEVPAAEDRPLRERGAVRHGVRAVLVDARPAVRHHPKTTPGGGR